MGKDMRYWISQLEKADEIIQIDREIDVEKEMGAVCHYSTEKSLLFRNIKGYKDWKILGQAPANMRQMGLAFEIDPQHLIPEISALMDAAPMKVKAVSDGPCKELIWNGEKVDLNRIPIHVHNAGDGGRFIGSGLAITRDPDTGIHNVAYHRLMIHGKDKTGFKMLPQHTWRNYEKYKALGLPMPVSVVIGHHPALYLSAAIRGAYEMDELELAGTLLKQPLEVIKSESSDLFVPADAEIVLEGEVPLDEFKDEGPFGEFQGYYFINQKPVHVLNIKTITMRKDAIYKILQSHPMAESGVFHRVPIGVAVYRHIKDVEGGVKIHNVQVMPSDFMVIIQVSPQYEGQAKNLMLSVLSSPFLHPKIAVSVDEDINIFDPVDVFWAISTRVNPEKDISIIHGVRNHPNDPSFFKVKEQEIALHALNVTGSKVLIDATKPSKTNPLRGKFDRTMPVGWGQIDPLNWINEGRLMKKL